MTQRLDALKNWFAQQHQVAIADCQFEPIIADASLRSYWRVRLADGASRILMDAPPELEDSHTFIEIGRAWRKANLPVPEIYAFDLDQGFAEIEDLGNDSLHHHFSEPEQAIAGTHEALIILDAIQQRAPVESLSPYSLAFLEEEMDRFPDWGLTQWLDIETPPSFADAKRVILECIATLPTVVVHRDFDAMNLMRHDNQLWIIDFQGALAGPLGYDLISLLRGRYYRWQAEELYQWVETFRLRLINEGSLDPSFVQHHFLRAVEAIGAQRQLKILGQFCRLAIRDGKPNYLDWLPHFYAHLDEGLAVFPELNAFRSWLETVYLPAMQAKLDARTTDANEV